PLLFFPDTSPTALSALSLHDALPICRPVLLFYRPLLLTAVPMPDVSAFVERWRASGASERANYQLFLSELCDLLGVEPPRPATRSEEHTSELQSRENLVCRLLLEKKK